MADKIYIEPIGESLDVMNKSSEVFCLPVRTDCTPYSCSLYVKDCNEQWNRIWSKICNCAKPYFLHYPQGEVLTFQTQFSQNEFTSVVVTMKDCENNEIAIPPEAYKFQYNDSEIQNFQIDTSLITVDLIGGWYLCFEHIDNQGNVLDCCFSQSYQPFEAVENGDCILRCSKGVNYLKIEGCNNFDCCGTVYGELSGTNVGSNIIHYPKIWIDGFTRQSPGTIENTFYGSKSNKSNSLDLITIHIGKESLPTFAHEHIKNIVQGGIIKVNGEKYMVASFQPNNTANCEQHFRYIFEATRECEVNQNC